MKTVKNTYLDKFTSKELVYFVCDFLSTKDYRYKDLTKKDVRVERKPKKVEVWVKSAIITLTDYSASMVGPLTDNENLELYWLATILKKFPETFAKDYYEHFHKMYQKDFTKKENALKTKIEKFMSIKVKDYGTKKSNEKTLEM